MLNPRVHKGSVNVIYSFYDAEQEHTDIEFEYLNKSEIDQEDFVRLLLEDLSMNANHEEPFEHLYKISTATCLDNVYIRTFKSIHKKHWNFKDRTPEQIEIYEAGYKEIMPWLETTNGKWYFDSHQYLVQDSFLWKLRDELDVGTKVPGAYDQYPKWRSEKAWGWVEIATMLMAMDKTIDKRTKRKTAKKIKKALRSSKPKEDVGIELASMFNSLFPVPEEIPMEIEVHGDD